MADDMSDDRWEGLRCDLAEGYKPTEYAAGVRLGDVADLLAERDRLAAEVERLRAVCAAESEAIIDLARRMWKGQVVNYGPGMTAIHLRLAAALSEEADHG